MTHASLTHFISDHEGGRYEACDDKTSAKISLKKPNGNLSVGVGFNMDRSEALEEWDEVSVGEASFDYVLQTFK